jgi:DNA modification methylase
MYLQHTTEQLQEGYVYKLLLADLEVFDPIWKNYYKSINFEVLAMIDVISSNYIADITWKCYSPVFNKIIRMRLLGVLSIKIADDEDAFIWRLEHGM